ncbi:MAG: LamG domain-containing protein [Mesorhizobium sp.]|nr:MAG: LamG domain-containing protein [Mesorhizobium sp.]RWN84358.1 MAG: LamG domain-containing protein [Mesorhizobium sp.]
MLLYSSFLGAGGGGAGTITDPYFASVVLLCGFNGSDGATSTTDEATAKAITFFGNAQLDTAQKKFGTASLLLDGTGDRLQLADSLDWQLGSTNNAPWTVEAWVMWNVLDADNRGIMGQGPTTNQGWIFTGASTLGELAFVLSNSGSSFNVTVTTSGAAMTTGVWYHCAADKDAGGKIRLYVDGVMLGSATPANSAIFNSNSALAIGAQGVTGIVDMNGWLDEVRITKGVARYASDSGFTVPTAAFPRS